MKNFVMLIIILSLCVNCINSKEKVSYIGQKNQNDSNDEISTSYIAYQTFDEFKMKGVGNEQISEPCVLVKCTPNKIIVKSSLSVDSTRVYTKTKNGIWHNHMEYDMWKKNSNIPLCKCLWDKPARCFDRYFYNDTIAEFETWYYNNDSSKTIYVKTKNEVFVIPNIIISLSSDKWRNYIYHFIKDNPKSITRYSIIDEKKCFVYRDNASKSRIEYLKQSYGLWGIQPGIYEACLYEGQDIRNFSSSHPNGLINGNNPNQIYTLADKMPSYKGDIYSVIRKQGKFKDKNISGRVVVGFIVEKNGTVSNLKIEKSSEPTLDAEALRIVSDLNNWQPAELNGEIVRCKMLLPITF